MKYKFLIILLTIPLANAETLNCKVVGVSDGDTITCLTDKKEQVKIRLYQIAAPEKKQVFGNKSKQTLSNLIFNKDVKIQTHGQDKYRRTLGIIYLHIPSSCEPLLPPSIGSCARITNVNLQMIDSGMAWYYPFAKKNPLYLEAQERAKTNKKGLWADNNAIAPWEFRKNRYSLEASSK